jgi:hypothetical protein
LRSKAREGAFVDDKTDKSKVSRSQDQEVVSEALQGRAVSHKALQAQRADPKAPEDQEGAEPEEPTEQVAIMDLKKHESKVLKDQKRDERIRLVHTPKKQEVLK